MFEKRKEDVVSDSTARHALQDGILGEDRGDKEDLYEGRHAEKRGPALVLLHYVDEYEDAEQTRDYHCPTLFIFLFLRVSRRAPAGILHVAEALR